MAEDIPQTPEHEHATNVQKSIEDIIGAKTTVKKRKKSQDDYKRELFFKVINILESLDARNELMEVDLRLDFGNYNEPYEELIESLLILNFGKSATNAIFFYLYERTKEDGSIIELLEENGTKIIPLDSVYDLWTLVNKITENNDKKYH